MKKGFDARIFAYASIAIILIAAFAAVNIYKDIITNTTKNQSIGFCNMSDDCEKQDLPHILCVGNWVCEQNSCGWICAAENTSTPTGGLSGSTVECYEDDHCKLGNCPDGTTYKKYSCLNNMCREINYFADPCRYR